MRWRLCCPPSSSGGRGLRAGPCLWQRVASQGQASTEPGEEGADGQSQAGRNALEGGDSDEYLAGGAGVEPGPRADDQAVQEGDREGRQGRRHDDGEHLVARRPPAEAEGHLPTWWQGRASASADMVAEANVD